MAHNRKSGLVELRSSLFLGLPCLIDLDFCIETCVCTIPLCFDRLCGHYMHTQVTVFFLHLSSRSNRYLSTPKGVYFMICLQPADIEHVDGVSHHATTSHTLRNCTSNPRQTSTKREHEKTIMPAQPYGQPGAIK